MASHSKRAPQRSVISTVRLETFCDAVIAIVITLLVLEIHVPVAESDSDLVTQLGHQWPSYFGFALSFVTIGIMWVNHHHMFHDIERVDHVFLILNLLLLLSLSFIPFSTAVLAQNLENADTRFVATLLYGGCFVATAILFNAVWNYAAIGRRLLRPDVSDTRIRRRTTRYLFGPVLYGATLPLGLVTPIAALTVYVVLALLYLLPIDD